MAAALPQAHCTAIANCLNSPFVTFSALSKSPVLQDYAVQFVSLTINSSWASHFLKQQLVVFGGVFAWITMCVHTHHQAELYTKPHRSFQQSIDEKQDSPKRGQLSITGQRLAPKLCS
ncbi:hypothetical protein ILYODFUR_015138 [Ilyodon furcidens]|uniref:Uncharacterized protein n=1 Tax=Ilyodon furcidens TaxID=33524 RepID=A0ABV0T8J6_9TELE